MGTLPADVVKAVVAARLVITLLAPAWNPAGHRTVARIAWDHMNYHARARAVALLLHGPARANLASLRPATGTSAERDRAMFVNAATWPDLIRNQSMSWHVYNRPTWHYADFYWDLVNGQPHALAGPEPVNAGERIAALRAQLADSSVADTTKAVALAWLLHLVGDIHQPLHCSSRVTAAEPLPRGDRGGNEFALDGTRNLHAYWDDILDEGVPHQPGEDSLAYAARNAHRIQQAHPKTALGSAAVSPDVPAWERDCLRLAQTVVYDSLMRGTAPSAGYLAEALRVSEAQMALAGYRLAALLNAALR
jgi:hypothetical protein